MSVLQILPSVNLRYCDIRDTLNAHGGRVTNFFQTAFCDGSVMFRRRPRQGETSEQDGYVHWYPDAKVNRWAKYRPVCHANEESVTDIERIAAGAGFRWSIYHPDTNPDGMVMNLTDMALLAIEAYQDALDNGGQMKQRRWQLRIPMGESEAGIRWPLRMADWRGYIADTPSPMYDHSAETPATPRTLHIVPTTSSTSYVRFGMFSPAGRTGTVMQWNIPINGINLSSYHVGLALVNTSSSDIEAVAISASSIGSGYDFVLFDFAALDDYDCPIDSGTYVTFLFLSPPRSGFSIGGTTILPAVTEDNRYNPDDFILIDGSFGCLQLYNGYTSIICAWDSEMGQDYQYPYWLPAPNQTGFFGQGGTGTHLELDLGPELEDLLSAGSEIWWRMTLQFPYDIHFDRSNPLIISIPAQGSGSSVVQPTTEMVSLPLFFDSNGNLCSFYIDPDHGNRITFQVCPSADYDGTLVLYCEKSSFGIDSGQNIVYASSGGHVAQFNGSEYNKPGIQNPPLFDFEKPPYGNVAMKLEILNQEVNP